MATAPKLPDPPKPAAARAAAPAAHTGDTKYFDGTVIKVDRDGNEVLSDHLEAGERLRRETTDRYSAVRATPPDADR